MAFSGKSPNATAQNWANTSRGSQNTTGDRWLKSAQKGGPGNLRRPPFARLLAHADKSTSTLASLVSDDAATTAAKVSKTFKEELDTLLIPGPKPASRADAMMIDNWVATALGRYVDKTRGRDENITGAVEDLVPILSIALHEVVRELTHECSERGIVVEKIWRTFVELFERVLRDVRGLLALHKRKTQDLTEALEGSKVELERLKSKYPAQVEKVRRALEQRFSLRQQELADQLKYREGENDALMDHLEKHRSDVQAWFPNFGLYKDSELRRSVGKGGAKGTEGRKGRSARDAKEAPGSKEPSPSKEVNMDGVDIQALEDPAVAVSVDLARVLTMIAPGERRLIGFYVSSMLGLTDKATIEELTRRTEASLTERKEELSDLKLRAEELELEIAALRGDDVLSPTSVPSPKGEPFGDGVEAEEENQMDGGSAARSGSDAPKASPSASPLPSVEEDAG